MMDFHEVLDRIHFDLRAIEEATARLRKLLHSGGTNIMQDTCRSVTILERQTAVIRDSYHDLEALDAGVPYDREYACDSTGQATWAPTPTPKRGVA